MTEKRRPQKAANPFSPIFGKKLPCRLEKSDRGLNSQNRQQGKQQQPRPASDGCGERFPQEADRQEDPADRRTAEAQPLTVPPQSGLLPRPVLLLHGAVPHLARASLTAVRPGLSLENGTASARSTTSWPAPSSCTSSLPRW